MEHWPVTAQHILIMGGEKKSKTPSFVDADLYVLSHDVKFLRSLFLKVHTLVDELADKFRIKYRISLVLGPDCICFRNAIRLHTVR